MNTKILYIEKNDEKIFKFEILGLFYAWAEAKFRPKTDFWHCFPFEWLLLLRA